MVVLGQDGSYRERTTSPHCLRRCTGLVFGTAGLETVDWRVAEKGQENVTEDQKDIGCLICMAISWIMSLFCLVQKWRNRE